MLFRPQKAVAFKAVCAVGDSKVVRRRMDRATEVGQWVPLVPVLIQVEF